MTALIAIALVGVGAYLSRSLFILALARYRLSEAFLRLLGYVAPAVLGALVVALLIDSEGAVAAGVPEVAALAGAGVVAWQSRNLMVTLAVGMVVFWSLRAVF